VEFSQLKATLKNQTDPVYVLYGVDMFLLYKSIELISNSVGENAEQIKFDEETPPNAVVSACLTPSFFGGKRVITYKIFGMTGTAGGTQSGGTQAGATAKAKGNGAGGTQAGGDKISTADINAYIKNPEPNTVLIIMTVAEKNVYNIRGATEVNCNPMNTEILVNLIAGRIAPKRITKSGAEFLCQASGNNYSIIDNELNKIVNYFTEIDLIDTDHIREFITKTVEYQIYELGTAILLGRLPDAEKIIEHCGGGTIAEYAIFGGLVSQFRRAYFSVSTGCDGGEVAKLLCCSPYAIVYGRRDFGGRAEMVAKKYQQSLELEYKIKSGRISIENAIFSLLTKGGI
jgi:DNA polymerase III delta subunit